MMIRHGARPERPDHRRFSFHRTFGAVQKFDISKVASFDLDAGFPVPDQNLDGFPYGCTAYTTASICGDKDRETYNKKYTYDKTLMMEGKPGRYDQGCNIQDALKSAMVYGVAKDGETDAQAETRRRGGYFDVLDGTGLSAAESIVLAMLISKTGVSIGTPWVNELRVIPSTGIVPTVITYDGDPDHYSWHNWEICGLAWINGTPYLKAKTWQGPNRGDRGFDYYPFETINKLLAIWGTVALMPIPFTPGSIQTVELTFWQTVLSFCKMWLAQLQQKHQNIPVTTPSPEPQNEPESDDAPQMANDSHPSRYSWNTPENARHSIRVICDETGLTYNQKQILTACVYVESGFYNFRPDGKPTTHKNPSSTDWGIIQVNDWYHIGAGKTWPSVDYVMAHPDEMVRWMAKTMKRTNALTPWVSYTSGAYKKWLPYVATPVLAQGHY